MSTCIQSDQPQILFVVHLERRGSHIGCFNLIGFPITIVVICFSHGEGDGFLFLTYPLATQKFITVFERVHGSIQEHGQMDFEIMHLFKQKPRKKGAENRVRLIRNDSEGACKRVSSWKFHFLKQLEMNDLFILASSNRIKIRECRTNLNNASMVVQCSRARCWSQG